MNWIVKNRTGKRGVAVFMAVLIILNMLPVSTLDVQAATAEHPSCVTVEVKDSEGNAVEGANVSYTIVLEETVTEGDTFENISATATTDSYGVTEVLSSSRYIENGLKISATVSKEGYVTDNITISNQSIASDNQNFTVILEKEQVAKPNIENIQISVLDSEYSKGSEQALISEILGEQEGDVTYYSTNGVDWYTEIPTEENAGEYPIYVKITRDGFNDYESGELTAKIAKANIDVTVTACEANFNEQEHLAVAISDLEIGDTVTCSYNGNDTTFTYMNEESINIPKIINVGEYQITVKIERNSNYNNFEQQYIAKIKATDIEGISATLNSNIVYNGEAQELVSEIEGTKTGDIVYFSLDDGNTWIEWTESQKPEAVNAGTYNIRIKVTRSNFNDTEIELNPASVTIAKADQTIEFVQDHTEKTIYFDAENASNNIYNFAAIGGSLVSPTITYRVNNASEGEDADISEIATIIESGENAGLLTILKAGYNITVTATVAGDSNHNEESVSYNLTIKNIESDLIAFPNEMVDFVIGTSSIISEQAAIPSYEDDNGEITYSGTVSGSDMQLNEIGITVNSENGKVSVSDVDALSDAIETAGGVLVIDIRATKAEGTKKAVWGADESVYAGCETGYTINITAEAIPSIAYTMQDKEGEIITEANGDNGWYNTIVTILPADGYLIARDSAASDYNTSVVFGENVDGVAYDQGQAERIVYLKNIETGAISAPITIPVDKLDNARPYNLSIEFPNTEEVDEAGTKYYNEEITIVFTAYDNTSGVDTFDWSYNRSSDASNSILEADRGTVQAVQDANDWTKYTASITLPKAEAEQLRGYLTVSASDVAGNASDSLTDTGIFVVDSISPTQTVSYQLKEEGGTYQTVDTTHYFSGAVEFTFDIVEANFYPQDVKIKVSKDGGVAERQSVAWIATENQDEYEAKLVLSEEGAYVVEMSYTDRSKKEMTSYTSETIVVDDTAPVIDFEYADYSNETNPQTATITITEHNFRKSDIEVVTSAKTIAGETVNVNDLQEYLRTCEWISDGDVHTASISTQFVDAIYVLSLNYKDLTLNPAEQLVTDSFIVDHTAPSIETMDVSYSNSLLDTVLSTITFGFYNPTVTITFTAYDMTAGVDYFTWSYTRQNDVSISNVEKYLDAKLTAVQDISDKAKFTASVTLPKDQAEQLRGYIAFTATDKYTNESEKLTEDKKVIVVDTISPTMTVEYTAPDNTFGDKVYYNKDITAIFTVTEANFYSEDVVVKLIKDDGTETEVIPEWTDMSTDVHVGTYTIGAPENHSNDGDYEFKVTYTDRSNNTMDTYTSDIMVVDTTVPIINIEYSNNNPVSTLIDSEGNSRKYFAGTQTATITIAEHNFNASDVEYMISAKDVAGNTLNVDALHSKSSWSTNGDNNIVTITYPGDANYTFDIAYTDLAMLEAADYSIEYFTVDNSKPSNLTVSYSTSILDTILSNISFGFYNAKMTVTVTASDSISKVNSFKYSYLNSDGVSTVNAQLTDKIIEASDIAYSEGDAKATASFEIPELALSADNQFNGTVSFNATDRSGNVSDYLQESKRVVVDNIAPTANVEYNEPVQIVNNISYYDGDINATVTINEANFYSDDVVVSVTRNGEAYSVTPTWNDNSTDVHTGSFTLTGDGDYFVEITYADKSSNTMQQYTSEQMTIDTDIVEATITVNGQEADGKAFKDDVVPAVSFEDTNFESYVISLTRTSFADKNVDVTEQFISGHITTNATGGSGTFDTFEKLAENDGIYTMTVSITDKAGHTVEKAVTFTVNRYGSVYVYSDYLISLIENGGAYVQAIQDDLVITEYNADRLVNKSLNIEISRDGKPLDSTEYDVTPEINNTVAIGSSGWYQYQYTISKDNFKADGVYKISVSSKDATGNTPENTNYEDKAILFRVDSTPPEIESITGLEESIINATNVEVKYTVYDTIGLESVVVYVNSKEFDNITDFADDMNIYSGSLTLLENASAQTVRLVVKDLAGNVTDTDSETFSSAYAFSNSVTVSTNILVRWFANKPLFWGSIAGAVVSVSAISSVVVFVKRKKKGISKTES